METNTNIAYDVETAREFIKNISSKKADPYEKHLDYNIPSYTDNTQKSAALEEADKYMRSVSAKSYPQNIGDSSSLDIRETTANAITTYNSDAVINQSHTGIGEMNIVKILVPDEEKFKKIREEILNTGTADYYDELKAEDNRIIESTLTNEKLDKILSGIRAALTTNTSNDENTSDTFLSNNYNLAKTLLSTLSSVSNNKSLTAKQKTVLSAFSRLRPNTTYGIGLVELQNEITAYINNSSKYAKAKKTANEYLVSPGNGVLSNYSPYDGTAQSTLLEVGTIKSEEGDDSSSGLPAKSGPGKKFLQEVDSLYKSNLKLVKYQNAYIQSGVEKSLTAYWNIPKANKDLLLGDIETTPPIILGISNIATDYADALNEQNGLNYYWWTDTAATVTANYKSLWSGYTHEENNMPVPAIELKNDDGRIVFKNHFPNWFMGTSTHSVFGTGGSTIGIQTSADLLGYDSIQEFLIGGASIADNTHQKYNVLRNQYSSPGLTDTTFDDKRRKYFNSAIKLLSQSMPDMTSNMFDVLLTVGSVKPISIFADDKKLRTSLLYNSSQVMPIQSRYKEEFTNPDEDIDFDSRSIIDRYVNARTLAMRCTGIDLPGIESSTYELQWLNQTLTKTGSRSTRNYTSSITIRLDMPMFFADTILALAGQYAYSNDTNSDYHLSYYIKSSYFYNRDGKFDKNDSNKLSDLGARINLYIPLFDFQTVKNNANANAGGVSSIGGVNISAITSGLGGKKMTYNTYGYPNDYESGVDFPHQVKLPTVTVYCFEDVRFLGLDNISFTSSGGDSPMTMPLEFTFRRFYKFLEDPTEMQLTW